MIYNYPMSESEALWKDVCKLLEGTGLPDGYRRKLLSTIAELVEATVEEAREADAKNRAWEAH